MATTRKYSSDGKSYSDVDNDTGKTVGGGLAGTESYSTEDYSSSGNSSSSSSNSGSTSSMQSALNSQLSAQTDLYNQQAAAQAAKIRQAIESQTLQSEATKEDYTNQMNTAIDTLEAERAKIPGQVATLNNTASSTGVTNAQKIRNSLAQMGLLQSGESASQQLLNNTTVQNAINANDLQGQELDLGYGNQIASAQTDLASKIKSINDAISLAQSQGDENALLVLQEAQAKIADAAATSAVNYNDYAYTTSRDAVADRLAQQELESTNVQNALDNVYRQSQADLAARQWQQEYDQSTTQYNQNYALQQQQLAADIAARQSAAASSSSGSSSANLSALKYQNELGSQQALASSMQGLQQMANNGSTRSEILKFINSNASDLQANGVSVQDLYEWASSSFIWDKNSSGNWYDTSAK